MTSTVFVSGNMQIRPRMPTVEYQGRRPITVTQPYMIHGLVDGVMRISPDMAKLLLSEAYYEAQGNRHKSPSARSHISSFAEIIRTGQFRGDSNSIYICIVEGRAYLVDGYHRMEAIIAAGIPVNVRVVLLHRSNMQEVALDYATYNRGTRSRTAAQVRGAFDVFSESSPVSKGLQNALHAAIPGLLTGFVNTGMRNMPPEMKTDSFQFTQARDWINACELYQQAIDNRTYRGALNKKFLNPSVVGVAVAILRYQPVLGMKFWTRVFDSGNLPSDDPCRVLKESINNRSDSTVRSARGLAAIVEAAWRKWRRGESAQILRVSADVDKPFAVYDTPYRPAVV